MLIDTGIKIDGTDITGMIAAGGVKWSRNDIDGPNAGRTLSGLMIRDRVATKIRLDITCRPLKSEELNTLLNLLYPEFVTVMYCDPMEGVVQKIMYANNHGAQFMFRKENSVPDWYYICHDSSETPAPQEYWNDISFPLVER